MAHCLYNDDCIDNHYTLGEKLGDGTFGITYLCTQNATGLQFACKCILKDSEETIKQVAHEIDIMYHLAGHPNIVTIKDVYEDAIKMYLVMELCEGGDLLDRMDKLVTFTEGEAASTMRSVIGIVEACHKKGIVHLDLKPENILFQTSDKNEVMKCIDFGCSKFFEPGQVFTDIVGTLSFAAPEVLKGCYGPEADI
jgi:calcium-dependent protein kinase